MKPALVVTNHYAGMGIAHGLGVMGVPIVVVAYGDAALDASKYVDATVRVPSIDHDEAGFAAALQELAGEYAGGILIPATDTAVVGLSGHKRALEEHYVVACPDWEIVECVIDKSRTYDCAAELGVPAPKTVSPTSVDHAAAIARDFEFPCLVKPKEVHQFQGHFRTKMFCVTSVDELVDRYREAEEAGFEVMVQEYIPGEDSANVNYNSYINDGHTPIEFTARKVRNAPPKYGSPRVVVSQEIPEIIEPGRAILKGLGYTGFSCVEFKQDARSGVYKLMEVNGRHNRSAMLAVRTGINFPWLEYAHLMLGEVPEPSDFEKNVYWIDVLMDVKHSFKHRHEERYSLRDYVRPYVNRHVFAMLHIADIRPFLKRVFTLLKKVTRNG